VTEQPPTCDHGARQPVPELRPISTVEPEHIEWLWPGMIPLGKLTVIEGDPGAGKSTMTLDLAARISTRSPMPDGSRLPHPRGVLLLTAEDGLADTIRPRLDAAGADTEMIFPIPNVPGIDEHGELFERTPIIPTDVNYIEQCILKTGAVLLVIDVLNIFLDARINAYRDQDVRRALSPLGKLAERTPAAPSSPFVISTRAPVRRCIEAAGSSASAVQPAQCCWPVVTPMTNQVRAEHSSP